MIRAQHPSEVHCQRLTDRDRLPRALRQFIPVIHRPQPEAHSILASSSPPSAASQAALSHNAITCSERSRSDARSCVNRGRCMMPPTCSAPSITEILRRAGVGVAAGMLCARQVACASAQAGPIRSGPLVINARVVAGSLGGIHSLNQVAPACADWRISSPGRPGFCPPSGPRRRCRRGLSSFDGLR